MTIERKHREYLGSAGDPKFRMVVLGLWTVDLKKMLLVMTDDPDNSDHHRIVLRTKTHRRPRLDNSRFSSPITAFLQLRSLTEGVGVQETLDNYFANWLGLEWFLKHNNGKLPSLFQIETGLIKEAMVQLTEAMMNVADLKAIVEAKNNISNTWKELFNKAQVPDRDIPLTYEILKDPTHPVVVVLNWTYTSEGFTYRVLNKSCKLKDVSKVPTLGPFSFALAIIINKTQQHRKDITLSEFSKCLLFRGTGLTESEIEEFRVLAKTMSKMRMFGYTSTSRNQAQAEKFAFQNSHSGIKRVVFHIQWEDAWAHYFMKGAFDHEEEVLLFDGTEFRVLSVVDEEYEEYELQGLEGDSSKYNGL